MEWIFKITDCPTDVNYPIIGHQVYDSGAKKGPFLFSIEDLVEVLSVGPIVSANTSSDCVQLESRTPILPRGTIAYAISEGKSYERLSMVIDKSSFFIRYKESEEMFEIPFPKMVVQYILRDTANKASTKKNIVSTYIFAIKDNLSVIDEDTELYHFPYTNVNKGNGQVCWGTNSFAISSIASLERFFTQFLSAPFNEDYGLSLDTKLIQSDDKLIRTFYDYIQFVVENNITDFNDDWLLPTNDTLQKQLGSKFIKN